MKFKIPFIAAILFCLIAQSQEEITTIVYDVDNFPPISEGFAIASDTEENFGVFLQVGKTLYANGYDKNFNHLSRLKNRPLHSKEKIIATKSYGNDLHIFLENTKYDEIVVLSHNFLKDTIVEHTIDHNLSKELLIETFEYDNKLVLLTIDKKNDVLNLHTIDKSLSLQTVSIDVKHHEFYSSTDYVHELYRAINYHKPNITGVSLHSSKGKFPMTLPESTSQVKLYKSKNNLILTLDFSDNVTQLLTINIETGETLLKNIETITNPNEVKLRQTNSFLLDGLLFQIIRRDNLLEVSIKNIDSGKELKRFEISETGEIPYTNTQTLKLQPSIKKREPLDSKDILKQTKKNAIGIYASKHNGKTTITYGAWNKSKGNNNRLNNTQRNGTGTVALMTVGFGIAGGLTTYFLLSGTGNSIQSYGLHHLGTTSRAISIFDENFEHLPNKGVKANIYHRIDYFNLKQELTTPFLLFQFNGDIIYGSFYPNQNALKLLKF